MLSYILWMLGLFWIIEALLCIWAYTKCFFFKGDIYKYGKGSWALITACTDGIGKGFAIELAKKGYNIVQVGRNIQKLKQQSLDLNQKYGVEVLNIVKEFSKCYKDPQSFLDIKSQTKGLDISIIINNIGTGRKQKFCDQSAEDLNEIICLNIIPLVFLSQIYLKDLENRKNGGLIINVCSVMSEIVLKNIVIYCSTKAFGFMFSNVLALETKRTCVMCLQPGFVATPLASTSKDLPLLISVEECVGQALQQIELSTNFCGHWKHIIFMFLLKFIRPFAGALQCLEN